MSNDAMHTIRQILGMRPDYTTAALDQLDLADEIHNSTLKNEHLLRAVAYSNLAVVESNRIGRHLEGWAGMEGNE